VADLVRRRAAWMSVGRDARDHDERCERDQDVDEAAQDDAADRVSWLRLSLGMDARGGDSQGIVAATAVDFEQAAGSFRAAAAQLREHELGAESSVPDEPVSLGPFTSTSAHVAGVAGNGSDWIARAQTSTALRIRWKWQAETFSRP
jgi:hypothetical protein